MIEGDLYWDGKNVQSKPSKPLISPTQLQNLFSNVDSILILHSLFLSSLEKRINHDWNHIHSQIGDIFTSLVSFFIYLLWTKF